MKIIFFSFLILATLLIGGVMLFVMLLNYLSGIGYMDDVSSREGKQGNQLPLFLMLDMLTIYIPLMIMLHASDEIYNYNNPRTEPKSNYILLNWEADDFYTNKNNKKILYPKAKADNYLKRKARNKYWQRKQLGREQ